jgi:uncharacterized protein YlxP (DUF503 family)
LFFFMDSIILHPAMPIGLLTLSIEIPGCQSLKEKRSRIKPLLTRLHREFNISVAEMGAQDHRSKAILGCALVNSDLAHIQRSLQIIPTWIERHWPDIQLIDENIETI